MSAAKLRSVQAMRAIAATSVVVCHATFFKFGAAGVDLFFVVSGFIIGTVMVGRSAKDFALARLWRIFPIYYFSLIPWVVVAIWSSMIEPARVASSLTLWPIWNGWAAPYNPLAWTLCFELFFYAVATIAIGRSHFIVPALGGLVALNLAFGGPLLNFVGCPMVLEFCAGLLLIKAPRHAMLGLMGIAAGLAILIANPIFAYDGEALMRFGHAWYRVIHWGVPAVLIAYGGLSVEPYLNSWSRPFVAVGDASYSIYLFHLLITLALAPLLWWPVTTAICLVAGYGMYLLIERPILRSRRQLLMIWRRRAAVAFVSKTMP